jgi:hypothetical protein
MVADYLLPWASQEAGDSQSIPIIRNALLFGFFVATAIAFTSRWIFENGGSPFAGFRSKLEPAFLVRLRFSWGARDMIHEGYEKVRMTI